MWRELRGQGTTRTLAEAAADLPGEEMTAHDQAELQAAADMQVRRSKLSAAALTVAVNRMAACRCTAAQLKLRLRCSPAAAARLGHHSAGCLQVAGDQQLPVATALAYQSRYQLPPLCWSERDRCWLRNYTWLPGSAKFHVHMTHEVRCCSHCQQARLTYRAQPEHERCLCRFSRECPDSLKHQAFGRESSQTSSSAAGIACRAPCHPAAGTAVSLQLLRPLWPRGCSTGGQAS